MRTTVKLSDGRQLVTHPCASGGAVVTIMHRATPGAPFTVQHEFAVDLNEGGAFSFGLDTAMEASQIARDRCVNCAGEGLCACPAVACPTPIACGIAA